MNDKGGEKLISDSEALDLSKMKDHEAHDAVKSSMSVEQLQAWQKTETRKEVKKSIEAQIKVLKEPLKSRNETSEEGQSDSKK